MGEVVNLATHFGLVVQPYRNDRHENVWVFRCWGTDACDGWLSLDHHSEQSAVRAMTGHVEEFHSQGAQTQVKIQISGGLTGAQRSEVTRIIEEHLKRAASKVGRS